MSKDLLLFLDSYVNNAKIIEVTELSSDELNKIPYIWLNLFKNKNDVLSSTLLLWEKLSLNLQLVYEYLKANLTSVDLVFYNNEYHLVFGLLSSSGKRVLYYHSHNPKNIQLSPIYHYLPADLKTFYQYFNGWNYLASESMGFLSINDIYSLDEYDWEILESNSINIRLDENFVVFENGDSGHICISNDGDLSKSLLWWLEEASILGIDFWPTIDTWIRLGFDD